MKIRTTLMVAVIGLGAGIGSAALTPATASASTCKQRVEACFTQVHRLKLRYSQVCLDTKGPVCEHMLTAVEALNAHCLAMRDRCTL